MREKKKIVDATPSFGHASALVGVVKRNLAIARARTIIQTFASRNEGSGSAVLIIL